MLGTSLMACLLLPGLAYLGPSFESSHCVRLTSQYFRDNYEPLLFSTATSIEELVPQLNGVEDLLESELVTQITPGENTFKFSIFEVQNSINLIDLSFTFASGYSPSPTDTHLLVLRKKLSTTPKEVSREQININFVHHYEQEPTIHMLQVLRRIGCQKEEALGGENDVAFFGLFGGCAIVFRPGLDLTGALVRFLTATTPYSVTAEYETTPTTYIARLTVKSDVFGVPLPPTTLNGIIGTFEHTIRTNIDRNLYFSFQEQESKPKECLKIFQDIDRVWHSLNKLFKHDCPSIGDRAFERIKRIVLASIVKKKVCEVILRTSTFCETTEAQKCNPTQLFDHFICTSQVMAKSVTSCNYVSISEVNACLTKYQCPLTYVFYCATLATINTKTYDQPTAGTCHCTQLYSGAYESVPELPITAVCLRVLFSIDITEQISKKMYELASGIFATGIVSYEGKGLISENVVLSAAEYELDSSLVVLDTEEMERKRRKEKAKKEKKEKERKSWINRNKWYVIVPSSVVIVVSVVVYVVV